MTECATRPRRVWLALVALGLAIATPHLSAHPTATTEVAITLRPRAADIVITADADALCIKLEALGTGPMSMTALPPAARLARIRELRQTLLEHIELRLDGGAVAMTLADVTFADDRRVAVHLSAAMRETAEKATWRTSLVYGSYLLVVRHAGAPEAEEAFEWLQGPEPSAAYPVQGQAVRPPRAKHLAQGFALGFTHILPNGLDHILFVLGLFFLTPRIRAVVAQATAFTVAHSITLALTLYGAISLPASVVEPLIALSIAYVALENLFADGLSRSRLAVVFGFGLLHGMGFAEALSRLDLPRSDFLTTLVTFNAGVEGGQLAIIAAAALLARLCPLSPQAYRRYIVYPSSLAIALAGAIWTVQRLIL